MYATLEINQKIIFIGTTSSVTTKTKSQSSTKEKIKDKTHKFNYLFTLKCKILTIILLKKKKFDPHKHHKNIIPLLMRTTCIS
jgi:hypothetical protein